MLVVIKSFTQRRHCLVHAVITRLLPALTTVFEMPSEYVFEICQAFKPTSSFEVSNHNMPCNLKGTSYRSQILIESFVKGFFEPRKANLTGFPLFRTDKIP